MSGELPPAIEVSGATKTCSGGFEAVGVALDNVFNRNYMTGFFRIGQPWLLRVEASLRL